MFGFGDKYFSDISWKLEKNGVQNGIPFFML